MSKVKGPLLSMRASGQVGQSQVFAQWRGIPYVRQYVVPANPQTSAQMDVRMPFRWLVAAWRSLPGETRAPWYTIAEGRPFTGPNKWISENLILLNGATDIQQIITSPGTRSGPPLAGATVTTGSGSGEINWSATVSSLPTGWSIQYVHAIAWLDEDPHDPYTQTPVYQTAAAPGPYNGTLTMSQSGVPAVVSIHAAYSNPLGRPAHSPSLTYTVTTG